MIKAYFISAVRNILRRKVYSLINILGLSVGLSVAALVVLYMNHELSYDAYHVDPANTYRLAGKRSYGWFPTLPIPYSDQLLEKTLPEVQSAVRMRRWHSRFMTFGEKKFYEEKVLITDPGSEFFDIFKVPLLEGNPRTALQSPNSVVISRSVASKYFAHASPVGRAIRYDTMDLVVTGVFENIPSNSHLVLDVLLTNAEAMSQASGAFTYCLLSKDANIDSFAEKITSMSVGAMANNRLDEVLLQPLKDLHFEANMVYEMKPPGSYFYLLMFSLIGAIILIISCANYINISIAVYAERAREIAVRKINGARNTGLAFQFWMESIVISLLCMPFVLAWVEMLLPWFNVLMGLHLTNEFVASPAYFLYLSALTLFVGLTAGIYPAVVLPRLKTVSLFKKGIASHEGISMRQKLITFQFTLLITLANCAWLIKDQIDFVHAKDLGFQPENVLKLTNVWAVDSIQYQTLKNELLNHPDIISVSEGIVPGDDDYGLSFKAEGSDLVYDGLISVPADYDYLSALRIEVLKNNFSFDEHQRPHKAILINETLARQLGYDDPVGKKLIIHPGEREWIATIDGVVHDYHFFSLYHSVSPVILTLQDQPSYVNQNILVRLETPNVNETLAFIKGKLNDIVPDVPVQIKWMTDDLTHFYALEQKLSMIGNRLLFIALLLASVGLIGFASYIIQLRTKEIGIRKVLGATVYNIIALLNRSFIALIAVAVVLGSTVSYVLMSKWLEAFAYKIQMHTWVFMVTGLLATVLTISIVGIQAVKAACTQPVKALRNE